MVAGIGELATDPVRLAAVKLRTHWMNQQSRAAIARLGVKQDGVLGNHSVMSDGSLRDTVVFSIIATEWPGRPYRAPSSPRRPPLRPAQPRVPSRLSVPQLMLRPLPSLSGRQVMVLSPATWVALSGVPSVPICFR
jgi:hypothetical protein